MNIYPAVDILNGQAVRLRQGRKEDVTVYGLPLEMAQRWERAGAEWLHVVDLDGAFEGSPKNHQSIAEIAATIPQIKIQVGSAYPIEGRLSMEVKGRDMVAGIPKTVVVNSDEIRDSLSEPTNAIVEAVLIALERTPPELAADIVDKGIVLTGGGALLKNLDVLLREETGLPVMVCDDPISAVVLGSGKALDHLELLKEVTIS